MPPLPHTTPLGPRRPSAGGCSRWRWCSQRPPPSELQRLPPPTPPPLPPPRGRGRGDGAERIGNSIVFHTCWSRSRTPRRANPPPWAAHARADVASCRTKADGSAQLPPVAIAADHFPGGDRPTCSPASPRNQYRPHAVAAAASEAVSATAAGSFTPCPSRHRSGSCSASHSTAAPWHPQDPGRMKCTHSTRRAD